METPKNLAPSCKNCGEALQGNFCSNCGQSAHIERVSFKSLLEDLSSSIFSLNAGFFFTYIQLFKRPGFSIREFLEGKRKAYVRPIAYLITASTIYFFLAILLNQNTFINDFLTGFSSAEQASADALPKNPILDWFSKNYAYTVLLLIPVFSLASGICFRSERRNFLEHMVLNSYITGQQSFIYVSFNILNSIFPNDFFEISPLFISVAYNFWVYQEFFQKGKTWVKPIKTLLTYLLFLFFILICFFIMMAIQKLYL
ncbi:DUF3667 domain-containing protein [Algoriphagus kandeliae]|uniref:DUF3667 domain-containing protein n=1 Tax=Algoriphagus kandeliae TaxID=2562278 RepID=A0A4Y9QYE2_9BACT|nr:DUF3667 domain-containing protein [Algoriphagus kandeliae]TFV97511.1 DUF3667 domain-containing protein [Algoriphagus kandeliae]